MKEPEQGHIAVDKLPDSLINGKQIWNARGEEPDKTEKTCLLLRTDVINQNKPPFVTSGMDMSDDTGDEKLRSQIEEKLQQVSPDGADYGPPVRGNNFFYLRRFKPTRLSV